MFAPIFSAFLPIVDDLDPSLSDKAVSRVLRTLYYKAVCRRILQSTGMRSAAALVTLLGVPKGDIVRARRKRRIPDEWFFRLCFEHRISLYWLLSGYGPQRLSRVPARNSREGRSLEHTLWYALCLYDEIVSAGCAAAIVRRMLSRRGKEEL